MSFSNGLLRLGVVIKWLGRAIGGIWLILLVRESTKDVLAGLEQGDEALWVMFVAAFLLVAITESIAWVLAGFAKDEKG